MSLLAVILMVFHMILRETATAGWETVGETECFRLSSGLRPGDIDHLP